MKTRLADEYGVRFTPFVKISCLVAISLFGIYTSCSPEDNDVILSPNALELDSLPKTE